MFKPADYELPLEGLNVRDAVIALQMIQRFVKSGCLDERELLPMGALRGSLVRSIEQATGINYDNPKVVNQAD